MGNSKFPADLCNLSSREKEVYLDEVATWAILESAQTKL